MATPIGRIGLTLFAAILVGIMLTAMVFPLSSCRRFGAAVRTAMTTAELANQRTAITNFFAFSGRWPTNYRELLTNSLGVVFIVPEPQRDRWGGFYVFEPFNSNSGFGRVLSYGRDRKPGGTNEDADVEVRFP